VGSFGIKYYKLSNNDLMEKSLKRGEESHTKALSEMADLFIKIASYAYSGASRSSFEGAFISEFFSMQEEALFVPHADFSRDSDYLFSALDVVLAFNVKGGMKVFRIYVAEEVVLLPKVYSLISSVIEGLDSGRLEIKSLFDEVELFDVSTGIPIYICKEVNTERYIRFKKVKSNKEFD
jgi:hypothetical protein